MKTRLLPKQQRKNFRKCRKIKRKSEIEDILCSGKRWKADFFTLLFKENGKKYNRFAIFVSKKNGTSVERNKIKRIFREFFRKYYTKTPRYLDILIKIPPIRFIKNDKKDFEGAMQKWLQWLKE